MTRILIAISTSRYSRELVTLALKEADMLRVQHEDVGLDVLYVIESDDLAEVGERVGGEGFLGMSPKQEVLDLLAAEHHRMALRRVHQVREAAEAHGYSVTFTEVQGRFADSVIRYAEKHLNDLILITRADRPFISRVLFGSETERVDRLARRDGLGKVIIKDD